jgi:hypothetical protein
MDDNRAIQKLRSIMQTYVTKVQAAKVIQHTGNYGTYRPSEIAMALAHYRECQEALKLAIGALQDRADRANDD